MPVYKHYQELKKSEHLEHPERIGACLTCQYWDAEGPRTDAQAPADALCMHPALQKFQLITSGGSGCNGWEKFSNVTEEAEAFAHLGED
ncbi:MAG TPA: hypothetical protein VGE41_06130 [Verrucomicrobiae bacterium]|jgi:hypothetical protein